MKDNRRTSAAAWTRAVADPGTTLSERRIIDIVTRTRENVAVAAHQLGDHQSEGGLGSRDGTEPSPPAILCTMFRHATEALRRHNHSLREFRAARTVSAVT